MFQLLILLHFVLYVSPNSVESKYHEPGSSEVTLRIIDPNSKETKKYYEFSDERKSVNMNCVIKSSGDIDDGYKTYVLKFHIDKNDEMSTELVTLQPGTAVSISRSFTIHKRNKEIVCKAFGMNGNPFEYTPLISRLPLMYIPPKNVTTEPDIKLKPHNVTKNNEKTNPSTNVTDDKHAKPKQNETTNGENSKPKLNVTISYLLPPNLHPNTDDSLNIHAVFTCTFQKQAVLLSWYQMKGAEYILLRSIAPKNLKHTLMKIFKDSDDHTSVFCAVRYLLHGQLSDEIRSKIVPLSFNKTQAELKATDNKLNISLWVGLNGAVLGLALIIITVLFIAMLRYRKKVKQFERDQNMRSRPPMTPPNKYEGNEYTTNLRNFDLSVENLYEQVYGHGAGLKRPKARPTKKK